MRFNKSFKVFVTREDTISTKEAIDIAVGLDLTEVYDPISLYSDKSWYWVAAILEKLQQVDLIREFIVLKEAPKDQQERAKPKPGIRH